MTDQDLGSNAQVDFRLEATVQGLFSIVNTGPLSIELLLRHQLDRENRESYLFRIFAIDRGLPPQIGQTEIALTVLVTIMLNRKSVRDYYHSYRMKMITLPYLLKHFMRLLLLRISSPAL